MKSSHIILIIVIAISVGVIFTVVGDFSSYETFASAKAMPSSEFHIVGTLDKSQKTEYDPAVNANLFTFYLIDKNKQSCKVVFNGTKPQDFEKSDQIVLTGKMNNDEFLANNMLLKCPSKYTNKKAEEQSFSAK